MGRVVILLDFCGHTQRHYCEHSDDIKSLAVNSDGIVVASGQKETNSIEYKWVIRIWRSDSLVTLYLLNENKNGLDGSPSYLIFSSLKNWLLILEDGMDHVLGLWDIKGQKITSTSVSRNQILSVGCDRKNENIFVTVGYEHIVWWEYLPHLNEIQSKFVADHRGFLKARITLTLIHMPNNDIITGDSNGTIYIWGKGLNAVTNYIKHAHESFIISLCVFKTFLFTGDKKGQIMLWLLNKNLDNLSSIMLPQGEGGVRRMLIAYSTNMQPVLIIGTTTNSLLQLPLAYDDKTLHPLDGVEFGANGLSIAISQGHYGYLDYVSSIIGHDSWFLTAGRDSQICVFDAVKHIGLQKTFIKGHHFTCIEWFSGEHIILGTLEGRCIILEQKNLDLIEVFNDVVMICSVTAVFTFPNQLKVYIGGQDGGLVVISKETNNIKVETEGPEENWIKTPYQSPIFGIDYIQGSSDENHSYLLISNKNGNLVVYETETMDIIRDLTLVKNMKWFAQHCGLMPDVAGAWMTPLMVEEKIRTASVNYSKSLVVMGTEQGKIAVYKYPCLKSDAYCHSNVIGNPVICVMFLSSDEHLISISGNNSCIIQWKIE